MYRTNRWLMSMMDDPAMAGLRQYMTNGRLRDSGGHGGGDDNDDDKPPPGDDDEDDEEEDEEDEDEDDKAKGKKSKAKKSKSGDDDDEDETVPAWKLAKAERRMRAADKRSSDLQTENEELKRKLEAGKNADPELKREVDELRPKVGKLEETNTSLRLQIAFLTTDAGIKWRDPEAALRLIDMDEVDIDDDGKIDRRSLKAAMKDLAKRKSYLVDGGKDDDSDEEDDDEDQRSSRRRSSPTMNGKRKGSKEKATREALAKRFPVLGRG